MKLSVMERFALLDLLPREGDFLTLKALRELRERLVPTDAEVKGFGIKGKITPENSLEYSWDKNEEVEIPMNDNKKNIVRQHLEILDRNKHLRDEHFSLYEKFIEADKDKGDKNK